MIDFQTQDRDQAIEAVSQVYCVHELSLDRNATSVATRVRANSSESPSLISLEYGADVEVETNLDDLILVMHANRGEGQVKQGGASRTWRSHQTIAVSGDQPTKYVFSRQFSQSTIRLNPASVRLYCSKLTGQVLDRNVQFELQPFTPALQMMWNQVLMLTQQSSASACRGQEHLNNFATDLLLHHLPHNYTDLLSLTPTKTQHVADSVIEYIDSLEDYELFPTVTEIASILNVSVRSIERSFRDNYGTTPAQHFRSIRLNRVRRDLEMTSATTNVTDIATAHGFFHLGRFSKQYKQQFRELPSETLQRFRTGVVDRIKPPKKG